MNHLLSSLPAGSSFTDNLETVKLANRQELERPNRPIEYVYFLENGIAAVMSISGETQIAVGLIGCEGSSGIAVFMGDDQSPHLTTMLTEGRAKRISAARLREVFDQDPELKRSLLRYSLAFYNQAAHTALSNAASSLDERVARWILMADDRLPHNEIPLTHERIATMLHARRAGVTTALQELQVAGLVEVKRSLIEILDRKGLEVVAGRFYGRPEVEFSRLIGTFWPPVPKQL
jgi:CRP-like cAMP-binding protein